MEHVWPRKPPHPLPGRQGAARSHWLEDGAATEPDERALARALFEAEVEFERRRRQRREAVVALALSSALPFVALLQPALVPPMVRALALIAWGAVLITASATGIAERRALRRMLRCADALAGGRELP